MQYQLSHLLHLESCYNSSLVRNTNSYSILNPWDSLHTNKTSFQFSHCSNKSKWFLLPDLENSKICPAAYRNLSQYSQSVRSYTFPRFVSRIGPRFVRSLLIHNPLGFLNQIGNVSSPNHPLFHSKYHQLSGTNQTHNHPNSCLFVYSFSLYAPLSRILFFF